MSSKTVIKNKKAEVIKKMGKAGNDTGSTEVQVALITHRINEINKHLTQFTKDFSSRRGLLKLVGQRRRLLNYLKNTKPKSYSELLTKLELRK